MSQITFKTTKQKDAEKAINDVKTLQNYKPEDAAFLKVLGDIRKQTDKEHPFNSTEHEIGEAYSAQYDRKKSLPDGDKMSAKDYGNKYGLLFIAEKAAEEKAVTEDEFEEYKNTWPEYGKVNVHEFIEHVPAKIEWGKVITPTIYTGVLAVENGHVVVTDKGFKCLREACEEIGIGDDVRQAIAEKLALKKDAPSVETKSAQMFDFDYLANQFTELTDAELKGKFQELRGEYDRMTVEADPEVRDNLYGIVYGDPTFSKGLWDFTKRCELLPEKDINRVHTKGMILHQEELNAFAKKFIQENQPEIAAPTTETNIGKMKLGVDAAVRKAAAEEQGEGRS